MPIQTAADSISNSQGSPFGFKNRIINGAMVIDQRNSGAAITPSASSQFTVDRFIGVQTQASKLTYQQVSDAPAGFINSLRILTASVPTLATSDQFRFCQCIEGFNVADLGWGTVDAQTITVSFRAKASVAGTYSVALWNAANGRSYVTTVSLTTAWATYSFTAPGDTTGTWAKGNTTGIELIFDLGASTTYTTSTTNTWLAENKFKATGSVSLVSNAAATLNITGVQVEKGTQATAFDYRDYGTELTLCQRYFQLSARGLGVWTGANALRTISSFQTTMRAAPTIAIFTPNAYVEYWNATGYNLGGSANIGFSTTSINGWDARIDSALASSPSRTYVDPAMVDFNTFSFSSEL